MREKHYSEERARLDQMVHPSLIPSPNLHVLLTSVKLYCRELAFSDDQELNCDPQQLINVVIATLNQDPESYDENLSDARELAQKLGVSLDRSKIPAKIEAKIPAISPGITLNDSGSHLLTIDGDLAGIRDVNGACRLAESLIPPIPGI